MIETVRALFAATRSGPPEETIDVALSLSDPRMEFTSRLSEIEGRRYDGHDGARRYFAEMSETWREWHNEALDIAEVGPDAVLVDNMFHAVGRDSGMRVTLRSAIVIVLSEDKVVRCLSYPSRDEALRAAGIDS